VSRLSNHPTVVWTGPGRAEFSYGPTSMRILARLRGRPHPLGVEAAAAAACECLESLVPFRNTAALLIGRLRREKGLSAVPQHFPAVLRLMIRAAEATGEDAMTPLAAVAGAIAQQALAAALAAGAGTVVVENGGDVAVSVEAGDTIRLGVARGIHDRSLERVALLSHGDGIGGVCTSGLGGRSFTLGLADAAVAFGADAAGADACATLLANSTFMDVPAVERSPAESLDPDTDIPGFMVVTHVGALSSSEITKALGQAEERAQGFVRAGLLKGAVVAVQGRAVVVPDEFAAIFTSAAPGRR
jgi:uncharacterized protein